MWMASIVPPRYLTPMEIRRAIKHVAAGTISDAEISLMIATADVNNDGYITFDEWKRMMLHDAESDLAYYER